MNLGSHTLSSVDGKYVKFGDDNEYQLSPL